VTVLALIFLTLTD